ncbi:hypothetical protein SORBI_3001G097800 [Sorghum bicolor]|uniref:Uncharacterized protein n=1 Tax=Sorghum bicolor TaxID=4558 RepID=A0A1Z5S5K6_SORBI|nr:hypothetical protein SORBI_3001G097800 [Sorghum bicolor]
MHLEFVSDSSCPSFSMKKKVPATLQHKHYQLSNNYITTSPKAPANIIPVIPMAQLGVAVAGSLSAGKKTASPPPKPKGGEPTMKRQSAKDQEAVAQVLGARKMGEDVGDAADVEGERKRKRAPIVVHHFPFHPRPGLL